MKLAVMSDLHVMGPGEEKQSQELAHGLGHEDHPFRRRFRRGLNRIRDRFWHWDPDSRHTCFMHALEMVDAYKPDLVVLNGDYGGDHEGVGLSDDHTFESAALVVNTIRDVFEDRARFLFGDHDIGKYNTNRRQGGIRLLSLSRGELDLGIESFWQIDLTDWHLIGVNSSLLTLDMFLPEALEDEVMVWERLRNDHLRQIAMAFEQLSADARIILFCHDPSALSRLAELPEVSHRQTQILRTVVGHLHTPSLMTFNRLLRYLPVFPAPNYPLARIVSHGAQGARTWKAFRPEVCPSTYGVGNHVAGGVLFLEGNGEGKLTAYRRHIRV